MFSSTAILPPRTKRWAEAKVLADCVSLKVNLPNSLVALKLIHFRDSDMQAISVPLGTH